MNRRVLAVMMMAFAGLSTPACNNSKATPAGPTAPSSPAPGPGDIGTSGGTVVDNGVTINVPSGALDEEVTITAEPGTKVARARYAEVGSPFLLNPAGRTFASPVTVELPYDAERLVAEGKVPSDIIVVHRNDTTGTITTHTPTQIDEVNKKIRVAITSFSTLQAAVPATADPAKSSIVLTTNGAVADGSQTVGIVVVAKNRADELFPGAPVVISATGAQNTLVQPALPTNEEGQASGTIASSLAESKTVSATVGGVAITATPQATFAQSTAPSLRITSPLPFERVPSGLALNLRWQGQLVNDAVVLSYSTDGGATYTQIADDLSASGTASWTPPENAIRVRLKIANAAGTVGDVQTADFSFARVWFVSASATGANDGTSWNDAFTQISSIGSRLRATDQVWLANGGSITGTGQQLITLQRDTSLLGGFQGGETAPSERPLPLVHSVLNAQDNARCFTLRAGGTYRIEGVKCLDGRDVDGEGGGGLFAVDASLELAHSVFESCRAPFNNGGAVFVDGAGHVTVENVQFLQNTSSYRGGALYATSRDQSDAKRLTIVDSSFTDNTASGDGGAVVLASKNRQTGGLLARLERCSFTDNSTTRSGGAVLALNIETTIVSCSFEGNTANYNGGAIWSLLSDLHLSQSTFTNNQAGGSLGQGEGSIVYGGGAVMVDEPRGGSRIERNRFVGNSSNVGGGGITVRGPTVEVDMPVFTNNVIASNTAYTGGGMMIGATGRAELLFNTITANTATQFGSGIGTMNDNTILLRSSIVYGNVNNDFGSLNSGSYTLFAETSNFTPATNDNLSADPGFVDAANKDFHLASGSICINAGTAADAPAVDFDGVTRDATPDIGAYERQ